MHLTFNCTRYEEKAVRRPSGVLPIKNTLGIVTTVCYENLLTPSLATIKRVQMGGSSSVSSHKIRRKVVPRPPSSLSRPSIYVSDEVSEEDVSSFTVNRTPIVQQICRQVIK